MCDVKRLKLINSFCLCAEMLYLFLGCVKPTAQEKIPAPPILPSPEAIHYAVGQGEAHDPLVARVSQGLPWDEGLSGAAAGVGLMREQERTLAHAQWAAVLSGYPYAIRQMVIGEVSMGEEPAELAEKLDQLLAPGEQLGLARVRRSQGDSWVALISIEDQQLEPFAREMDVGEELSVSGAVFTWRLGKPSGGILAGQLPLQAILTEEGEYWLELSSQNQVVASVPIYVGMSAPPTNLFSSFELGLVGPEEVQGQLLDLLNEMKGREGLPLIQEDETLNTLSQLPLKQLLDGEWSREKGEERLRSAGFVGGPIYQLSCSARSTGLCLDQLSWQLEGRMALLDDDIRVMGSAVQSGSSGVTIILSMASE